MNHKTLFILLFLLVAIFSCGKQAITRPNIAFQKISVHGITHFVYIKPSEVIHNQNYLDVSTYICDELKVCVVIFWDKRSNVPFTLPMTDRQASTKVAHYNLNEKTKLSELQLCNKGQC